eukprot:TRINITY_DN30768_c0_g1_i1.p1 TRINITY_DN30768_c0_g1~~TRINITY_DN30768_c0_g1_i1.p1  ORF type:complete len:100 (+),score=9.61 TRINITY_DN30768_c0_g1_i1:90-389(+)
MCIRDSSCTGRSWGIGVPWDSVGAARSNQLGLCQMPGEREGSLEVVAPCTSLPERPLWRAFAGRWSCTVAPRNPVSYTHLRAHETPEHLVCRLLLEKKN